MRTLHEEIKRENVLAAAAAGDAARGAELLKQKLKKLDINMLT